MEKPEDREFEPYEKPEMPKEKPVAEAENVQESAIVDNEQDAEIVLEAAVEALKQEEKGEGKPEAGDVTEEEKEVIVRESEKENPEDRG